MTAPVRAMQWTHPEAAAAIVAWGDGDIIYDAAVECQVGDPSWGDLRVESHWVNEPVPPGGWVVLGDDDEYRVAEIDAPCTSCGVGNQTCFLEGGYCCITCQDAGGMTHQTRPIPPGGVSL